MNSTQESSHLPSLILWFTPLLVVFPIIVSFIFFTNGVAEWELMGQPMSLGKIVLGSFILIGNLVFDVPFLRALKKKRVT